MPLLIIGAFLAVELAGLFGPPIGPALMPRWVCMVAIFGPHLVLCAGQLVVSRWAAFGLDRRGAVQRIRVNEISSTLVRFTAVLWHAASVLLFGWAMIVRDAMGDRIGLDEFVIALPPILVIVWTWVTGYSIEARTTHARMMRQLDAIQPMYAIAGRWAWVWMQTRSHVLLFFALIGLIRGWSEWVGRQIEQASAGSGWLTSLPVSWRTEEVLPMIGGGLQLAGALGIMSLAPILIRVLWRTHRVPDGPLRQTLTKMCRAARTPVADLLIWSTGGAMTNGLVVGLTPWLRAVILTDALVERLTTDQVRAVVAHEVGHVRMRHMLWLAISVLATVALIGGPAGWLAYAAEARFGWGLATELVGGAITLGATLIVLGWVSRRFEWQADAFAVRTLSGDTVGAEPVQIKPEAAHAMSSALGWVAALNGMNPDAFMWRHGSINRRRRRVAALVDRRSDDLRIDRTVRRIKWASLAGGVSAVVLIWIDPIVSAWVWEISGGAQEG